MQLPNRHEPFDFLNALTWFAKQEHIKVSTQRFDVSRALTFSHSLSLCISLLSHTHTHSFSSSLSLCLCRPITYDSKPSAFWAIRVWRSTVVEQWHFTIFPQLSTCNSILDQFSDENCTVHLLKYHFQLEILVGISQKEVQWLLHYWRLFKILEIKHVCMRTFVRMLFIFQSILKALFLF